MPREVPPSPVEVIVDVAQPLVDQYRAEQAPQEAHNKQILQLDRKRFRAEKIGLVGIAFTVMLMSVQWYEMRSQTKAAMAQSKEAIASNELTRSTLELTKKGLSINLGARCQMAVDAGNLPDVFVSMACEPNRLDANILTAELTASRIDLQTFQPIGEPQKVSIPAQRMSIATGEPRVAMRIEGFSRSRFYALREGIEFRESWSYTDGFDQTVPQNRCETYIPYLREDGTYSGAHSTGCGTELQHSLRKYREKTDAAQPTGPSK